MAGPDEEETHEERLDGFLRMWGTAEAFLDIGISLIYRKHNGREVDDQCPVTLERKLTFLKAAVETVPSLMPYREIAMRAHRVLMDEKDLRNTIVHGIPLKRERRGGVHFLRIVPNFDAPLYRHRHVRAADWERLHKVGVQAITYLGLFVVALDATLTRPGLDMDEKQLREWFVQGAGSFPGSKRLRYLLQEICAGET